MTKRIICLFLSLLICVLCASYISAEEHSPRLVDGADLLTDGEFDELNGKLDAVSERLQFDVIVRTVLSTGDKYIEDAADDMYDYNDYGYGDSYDGVLLLIDMDTREWYITTCGFGITAFTDAGIEYIGDKMSPYLSDGEYAEAFGVYVKYCEEFVIQARNGEPYDSRSLPKDPYDPITGIGVSLLIAFIIALISTGVMKGKLKSVHRQTRAAHYVREGSMHLTRSNDLFLYRTFTRVPRPKSSSSSGSSTRTSSSGRSHGGGGGRF